MMHLLDIAIIVMLIVMSGYWLYCRYQDKKNKGGGAM